VAPTEPKNRGPRLTLPLHRAETSDGLSHAAKRRPPANSVHAPNCRSRGGREPRVRTSRCRDRDRIEIRRSSRPFGRFRGCPTCRSSPLGNTAMSPTADHRSFARRRASRSCALRPDRSPRGFPASSVTAPGAHCQMPADASPSSPQLDAVRGHLGAGWLRRADPSPPVRDGRAASGDEGGEDAGAHWVAFLWKR